MSTYEKEKRKVSILLGVGVVLMIIFLISVINEAGFKDTFQSFTDLGTWFVLVLITFYPLGIVYGWRKMLGDTASAFNFRSAPADRYYTVQERTIHKNGHLVSWAIKMTLIICFGWIFGTVTAFQKLQHLKNEQ